MRKLLILIFFFAHTLSHSQKYDSLSSYKNSKLIPFQNEFIKIGPDSFPVYNTYSFENEKNVKIVEHPDSNFYTKIEHFENGNKKVESKIHLAILPGSVSYQNHDNIGSWSQHTLFTLEYYYFGNYIEWHSNGKIKSKGFHKNRSKKHGKWLQYDEKGNLRKEVDYINGNQIESKNHFHLSDTIFKVGDLYRTYNITFPKLRAKADSSSYPTLDSIANFLIKNPKIKIEVSSRLDFWPSSWSNDMSARRNDYIFSYLHWKWKIDKSRFFSHSCCSCKLYDIKEGMTEEEKEKINQLNRYVEFQIFKIAE